MHAGWVQTAGLTCCLFASGVVAKSYLTGQGTTVVSAGLALRPNMRQTRGVIPSPQRKVCPLYLLCACRHARCQDACDSGAGCTLHGAGQSQHAGVTGCLFIAGAGVLTRASTQLRLYTRRVLFGTMLLSWKGHGSRYVPGLYRCNALHASGLHHRRCIQLL